MVFLGLMRAWVRTALWFRFRRISRVFHAPPPLTEAAILAGNHQNGHLDSLTLASSSPRVPYTLSRGSLFNIPVVSPLLRALQFLPVYRFRDGFGRMRRNREVFAEFVEVLGRGQWLLLFPEGSHCLKYTLRPLQKGLARIAFAAQEAQGWEKEIPVIPVGLQYESHTAFGARLLVQYGSPISTLAFKGQHGRNPKEAERALMARVFDGLRELLILPPQDEDEYDQALRRWRPYRGRWSDLMEQFRTDRSVVEGDGNAPPEPEPKRVLSKRLAGYGLSFPGVILQLPVLLAILAWEKVVMRDIHLMPAARFTVGMVLTPVYWIGALVVLLGITDSWPWASALVLLWPVTLWLWSRFWHWTR
jgi:1-acyl-sn-glycerol-3-phosphate acyltransferase